MRQDKAPPEMRQRGHPDLASAVVAPETRLRRAMPVVPALQMVLGLLSVQPVPVVPLLHAVLQAVLLPSVLAPLVVLVVPSLQERTV